MRHNKKEPTKRSPNKKKRWVIEFWDFGEWDVMCAGTKGQIGWSYKAQAIEHCEELNRSLDHQTRKSAFCGHKYRVRKREV